MSAPPRFIYFDLGNVLLHFDHELACRQMADVAEIPVDRVRDVLFNEGLQQRYEKGEITSSQLYETFCERTGTRIDAGALLDAGSAIFELNLRMVPLVAQLCAVGYRLGILSNTCEAHWEYVNDGRFRMIRELFEVYVLSFRVGTVKPSPEIYQTAADLAQVGAHEIFFTDDCEENVAGARAVGFDAVVYRSPNELADQLRSRGVEFNY